MNLNEKNAILEKTRDRLQKTCAKIVAKINCTKEDLRRSEEKFSRLSNADKLVESKIISYNEKRINELNYLKGSPYFVRCQVRYDKENKETSLNFGKFSFTDDLIYSWIAPASSIRFEEPGDFEYKCPDGNIEKGKLLRKDQFMIVNGEIRFLSTEGLNSPRELIYQEHFSNRKTGFVLPEIVAEMERIRIKSSALITLDLSRYLGRQVAARQHLRFTGLHTLFNPPTFRRFTKTIR